MWVEPGSGWPKGAGGRRRTLGVNLPALVEAGSLSASVVTDEETFYELAEAWDHLVDNCASSTPFQTHAWLSSWWRSYGTVGRLRVLVAHDGPELVAGMALFLSGQRSVRVLSPIGVGLSDFCDVLVQDQPGQERNHVVDLLGRALADMGGWDMVDLPEVRPGAAALELYNSWKGATSTTPASTCLELPTQDLNSLIEALPRANSNTRSRRRAKLRKLDEVGITSREVQGARLLEAISDFHRLHLSQWEARGVAAEHKDARFRRFLTTALPPMVDRGQAVVVEFHLAGRVMAVGINLVGATMVGLYLAGVAPALRKHVEVSTLLLREAMGLALDRKTPVFSFLRGLEDYKLRWRPQPVLNRRLLLGRPGSLRAHAHIVCAEGRALARPWLRAHAPWLKDLRSQARRRTWSPALPSGVRRVR